MKSGSWRTCLPSCRHYAPNAIGTVLRAILCAFSKPEPRSWPTKSERGVILSKLQEKWESILRSEGLSSLDGVYTKKSKRISYVITDRNDYVRGKKEFYYEYFNRCRQYLHEGSPRWPNIWQLYSDGVSWRKIARIAMMSPSQIQYRIELMKKDMIKWIDELNNSDTVNDIPFGAEILEVFVEQQRRGR